MSNIGRPPKNPRLVKQPYSTRLPAYVVDWLREQDNAAADIERALINTFGIDDPTPADDGTAWPYADNH